jgi:hypothetical protein
MTTACKRCLLPDTFPGISFDENGVCNHCTGYTSEIKQKTTGIFESEAELIGYLEKYKNMSDKYDVLVPASGGVDSSNALVTIVEKYKLRPLVYHNDDGYVSKIATQNVKSLCAKLDVDLVIWQHDMIFMKKLFKYVNQSNLKFSTCLLCGTILYINNIELARKFNIPLIINGFSKGAASMITDRERYVSIVTEVVEEVSRSGDKEFVRKFYNKFKLMDEHILFQSKDDFENSKKSNKTLFIPYYLFKFNKTDKEAYKKDLMGRFDWNPMPASYPRRTTNCEMIWINTYRDLKKMNYTYFTEEYSQLIREGEFSREQAMEDLKFNPPAGVLKRLASEIEFEGMDCPDVITLDCIGNHCKE